MSNYQAVVEGQPSSSGQAHAHSAKVLIPSSLRKSGAHGPGDLQSGRDVSNDKDLFESPEAKLRYHAYRSEYMRYEAYRSGMEWGPAC